MNKRLFYRNTALVTVCSLLLRLCGILFRILLSGRIGAEGIGLYQLVFSVHVLGSTFALGGLLTAVTCLATQRLSAQDDKGLRKLMRVCTRISVLVGGISACLLYGFAPQISQLIGDSRSVTAVALCGIALPCIGIDATLKGYFLARRRAWPSCIAQMLEQTVRIGTIIWWLETAWDGTLEQACVWIIVGDALAETVSCIYLSCAYHRDRKQCFPAEDTTQKIPVPILRPLLYIALPLTAGRYLTTALRTVENVLVPARLSRYTQSEALALAQFGAVKGMALPLVFFPSALLMTVSGLLIPELADAHALQHRRQVSRLVEIALHITLISAIFVGGLFTAMGVELGQLLYHDHTVGLILLILGPLTPIMYLDSVATVLLKGLGQQVRSLWYAVADSVIRIGLIWLLLPHYGLIGFLFVMLVSNLLTCALSTARLLSVSGARIHWARWVILPSLAAIMGGQLGSYVPLSGIAYLSAGSVLYTAVYAVSIGLFRCFTREDWRQLTARKA